MIEDMELNRPWMLAVWPGMGKVAMSAGYYLVAKLGAHVLAKFSPEGLFDVEHVEVKSGLIRTGRFPRSRLFLWKDPAGRRDIIVFIGEAQPPIGKYAFCRKLITFVQDLGVERVFTFAAMATQMRPEDDSRVFGAAIDEESLAQLKSLQLTILDEGYISGLNGVLLGAAAESGLRGACLLGEMPHVFARLPYPKASLAVLEVFAAITGIELDFAELSEQAQAMEERLGELLVNMERAMQKQEPGEQEAWRPDPTDDQRLSPPDERRIEQLFQQAQQDRSKAYELKRELDRLEVFEDYEDRFLDLFKKPD